ncbi:MAG: hypothetical protein BKP49_09270 [Treponema sp. CETP13]|nr:MAG: hypothetical protein BKP49_09270 [Treponema sp. CETP13]
MKKRLIYFTVFLILLSLSSCETTKLESQSKTMLPDSVDTTIENETIDNTKNVNDREDVNEEVMVSIVNEEEDEDSQSNTAVVKKTSEPVIINTDDTILSNDYSPSVIKSDEPFKSDIIADEDDSNVIVEEPKLEDDTVFIVPLDQNEEVSNESNKLIVLNEEPTQEITKIPDSSVQFTESDNDLDIENSENEIEDNDVNTVTNKAVPISKYIEAIKDESFDVVMKGKKWIYLGETDTKESFTKYNKRLYDNENTLFKFKAINTGTVILHFYKQDLIDNENIGEYVQVTISNAITLNPNVTNTNLVGEEPILTNEVDLLDANEGENTLDIETNLKTADELYDAAKDSYDNGNYQNCIAYLDQFFINAVSDIDKGWFLLGQTYEKKSEIKDIKKALESYKTLVESYPDSKLWKQADNRIKYINRYYYNIH